MNNDLTPKLIQDKNGKTTTVHVKTMPQPPVRTFAPAPVVFEPTTDEEATALALSNLQDGLAKLFDEYEIEVSSQTIHAEPHRPDRYPEYNSIDITITVPTLEDGKQGVVMVYQGTDYQWTNTYSFKPHFLSDNTVQNIEEAITIITPEILAYHDALYKESNGVEVETPRHFHNPEDARAFLLEFAGYESFHEQSNERLLGMCHKIAGQERFAHHIPEIMEAAEILIEADRLHIYDHMTEKYEHSFDQYRRVRDYR